MLNKHRPVHPAPYIPICWPNQQAICCSIVFFPNSLPFTILYFFVLHLMKLSQNCKECKKNSKLIMKYH